MANPQAGIVQQYIQSQHALAHVRPYRNQSGLQTQIEVSVRKEALPEDNHYRVELDVLIEARNAEDVVCYDGGVSIEAIAFAVDLTPEQLDHYLSVTVPGLLLGNARSQIATLSLQTGYGPFHLPPMSGEQLLAMSQKHQADEEVKEVPAD